MEQAPAAATPAEVMLYSVQGLAEVLGCDPGTVRRWLKVGKLHRDDPANPQRNLKLQAFYFNSEARIDVQVASGVPTTIATSLRPMRTSAGVLAP